jgi:ribonuclease BN (tRNA processing enzyme)
VSVPPPFKIRVLGTGGYHPNERRQTACVFLPEFGLAFDAGTATFRLPQFRQIPELTVLLSHAHLDHVVGLTFLLVPLLKQEFRHIRVLAAPEHIDAVVRHLFNPALFPVRPAFEFLPLPERLDVGGGGQLRHLPMPHPGGSTGYRIDWPDRSLAYITDTTAGAHNDYADFIRGVDVLLHECNFPDHHSNWAQPTGHSHVTPVAELALRGDVGRLYLLHFDPQNTGDDPVGLPTARAIFPQTWLLQDFELIELPARSPGRNPP